MNKRMVAQEMLTRLEATRYKTVGSFLAATRMGRPIKRDSIRLSMDKLRLCTSLKSSGKWRALHAWYATRSTPNVFATPRAPRIGFVLLLEGAQVP